MPKVQVFEELRQYVRFDQGSESILRAFLPAAEPHFPRLAIEFYDRIREHEDAHAVFADEAQIVRLQRSMVAWLTRILSGPWDAAYIAKATMEIFTSLRTPAVSFVHPVDLVLRAAARLFPSLHIKRVVLVKYSRPAKTWRDVDPPKDPWVVGFECEADAPYALLRTVWGVELSEAVQMEGSVCCDMLGWGFELLCRHPIVARLDMLAEAVIIGALPTFRDSCTFRLSVGM